MIKKSSYKHVSDFGRLRSYDRLKLVYYSGTSVNPSRKAIPGHA